jgi:hypothetical protein
VSTPDGEWEEVDEVARLVEMNLIAVDQYEIYAGTIAAETGLTPAIRIVVSGILAKDLGNPAAEGVKGTFLLSTDDAVRFAQQVAQACDARST